MYLLFLISSVYLIGNVVGFAKFPKVIEKQAHGLFGYMDSTMRILNVTRERPVHSRRHKDGGVELLLTS